MRTLISRASLAAPAALVLSLVIASTATAVTWNPKITLNSSGIASSDGLVVLNATTAVALYEVGPRVYTRRTTSSGSTWASKVQLTDRQELWADIGGRGTFVDVVFDEYRSDTDLTVIQYRRSINSGVSYQAPLTLSSVPGHWTISPGVAHGPNNVVVVAWHDLSTNTIRARVSTNDGMTFGPEANLATVTGTWMHPPAVAVGDGVIYAAYYISHTQIRLRRSLTNGSTWLSPVTLGNNGTENPTIDTITATAVGERAFVGFTVKDGSQTWTRYRRTNNGGGTWSSQVDISPPSANLSTSPELTLQGTRLHAVYEQCGEPACTTTKVMYRTRTVSGAWSKPQQASHAAPDWATPAGVGQATKLLVLYEGDNGETSPYGPNSDVYVRVGTP